MANKLIWTISNPLDRFTGYEIYRSTDKATVYNPENKIGTIGDKTQTSYTDETAPIGEKFYYGIVTLTDSGPVPGKISVNFVMKETGEGENTLKVGELNFGLLDIIRDGALLRTAIAQNDIEISKVTTTTTSSSMSLLAGETDVLYKLIYDGSVIFVPNRYVNISGSTSIRVSAIYAGISDLIDNPPTIELNGSKYTFRLLTPSEFTTFVLAGLSTNVYTDGGVIRKTYASSANDFRVITAPGPTDLFSFTYDRTGAVTASATATANNFTQSFSLCWCLVPQTDIGEVDV